MRAIFGIGIGETGKKWGQRTIPMEESNSWTLSARDLITRRHGGCFVQYGEGDWLAPDGRIVSEQGITITVNGLDKPTALALAEELREHFRQDSVALTLIESEELFV